MTSISSHIEFEIQNQSKEFHTAMEPFERKAIMKIIIKLCRAYEVLVFERSK